MCDISSIGANNAYTQTASSTSASNGTGDVKAAISVKMMQASQAQQQVLGSIIEDTASVSKEAMAAYKAEKG